MPKAPTLPAPVESSKKAFNFAGFKGTSGGASGAMEGPNLDDSIMMRLKNAEKRRVEEKARKEEAAIAMTSTIEVAGI